MAKLVLQNLYKDFGEGPVVNNVSLEINDHEFCVLVGASGSGKSTILRMIAGLEKVTSGQIYLDDKLLNNIHPGDRNMAMVFQNYALYAHMSVADNLGYSLRIQKVPKEKRMKAVQAVADKLQIVNLLNRKPRNLSGGERQRVALGRAIIRQPEVFLMDEPLSNLDAMLRVEMRTEILRLQHELQTTTVYVTHDQIEAMSMADKLVLLHNGMVEQIGSPDDIYNRPVNRYVASFVGTPIMNFIGPGELNVENDLWRFNCTGFSLILPEVFQNKLNSSDISHNKKMTLGIRAEAICVGTAHPEWKSVHRMPAQIKLTQNLGSNTIGFTDFNHQMIAFMLDSSSGIIPNEQINLNFDLSRIHLFDLSSGTNLMYK